jgi:aconitate hydratase
LQFRAGETVESLGLSGEEVFSISGIAGVDPDALVGRELTVRAGEIEFRATLRIDTPGEAGYLLNGGILPYMARQLAQQ